MRAVRSLILVTGVLLALGVADCSEVTVSDKPNLLIWGPASVFQVVEANPQDPVYELSVNVMNFAFVDAGSFVLTCSAVGTDVLGGNLQPLSRVDLAATLSLEAFAVKNHAFTFKWPSPGPRTGNWLIECEVDSAKNVIEASELDNRFTFFFDANCIGSLPCPGLAWLSTAVRFRSPRSRRESRRLSARTWSDLEEVRCR